MILNFDSLISKYNMNIKGIIHIGAHYGQEYNLYKRLSIKNLIFFEPLSLNFINLKKNVGSECVLHNLALGNKTGKVEMYVETNNFGMSSSVLEPYIHTIKYPNILFDKRECVNMKCLDDIDFIRQDFNMINIDVQGYELEVLKGGSESLKNIDYIISELNSEELYKDCARIDDIVNFLNPYGFKLVELDMSGGNWGDGLFLKQ